MPRPADPPRMFRVAWLVAALSVLVAAVATAPARACPACREAVADNRLDNHAGDNTGSTANPSPLAAGFSYSVLFMIGMVSAVPLGLGAMLMLSMRRHAPRALNQTRPPAATPEGDPRPFA